MWWLQFNSTFHLLIFIIINSLLIFFTGPLKFHQLKLIELDKTLPSIYLNNFLYSMEGIESMGEIKTRDDVLILTPRPSRNFISMPPLNPNITPLKDFSDSNNLHFTFNSNFTYNPKHFTSYFPPFYPFFAHSKPNDLISESLDTPSKNDFFKLSQETSQESTEDSKISDEEKNHGDLLNSLANSSPLKRPREKKPLTCSCRKSKCLKLYCECFATGQYCTDCACTSCANTEEKETQRKNAINLTLERNPEAFKPKFKSIEIEGEIQSVHNKGCHCSRSACLKKYCECYQNGNYCSNLCQCAGCKNI
ncbi:unnamed protein product [Blepharisma stoltei]|uniref:CRC domain-containing protein n=1 Tax=Blepharisma stoltei TaxID=1481888 RepID=A0AAU9JVF6_9CILI|nr:unnamed protein product [Blepharisma stoltei]